MRPQQLNPLFRPVSDLRGVGTRIATLIGQVAGPHVVDLCWHLPTGIIDRRYHPTIAEAEPGRVVTLTVTVGTHQPAPPRNARVPYKVWCFDETGGLSLVFFHARGDYLRRVLPQGQTRIVSGRVDRYGEALQMTHPDFIVSEAEMDQVDRVQPVYRLTSGLSAKVLGKATLEALKTVPDLPEWLTDHHRDEATWPSWSTAVRQVHAPESEADLDSLALPRQRLAYDELLANQVVVALTRARHRQRPGRSLSGHGRLSEAIERTLPFQLTTSQRSALSDIRADMGADRQMLRLLQGDVGSGKTVVALLAMATAIEADTQAALMAPTEILARQHFATIQPLAAAAGLNTALMIGSAGTAERSRIALGLASGDIQIVVGTHAIIQQSVSFRDLAFAVVDEQHRFGVHQRMLLAAKGRSVDLLVMTATPIPRTLLLAAYGDIDESRLTEKPAGRKPVDTRAVSMERMHEVVDAVDRATKQGARAYWICPLVEESEVSDLAAASDRHQMLNAHLLQQVGLVHGRMKTSEKDAAMRRFADGDTPILVATTVVEVGVDVPEATLIVIEHAERFGLAQLHQLRGRVGRGDRESTCLLLYQGPLGETARARLRTIRQTDDGFKIAEEDLRIRGGGDVLGTRQSGLPSFRLADLAFHADLLATARDDARSIVEQDPQLTSPRGQALRTLLYLFQRDEVVRYLQAA